MNVERGGPSRALRTTLLTLLLMAAGVAAADAAPKKFFGVMPQTALTDEDFTRMGEAKVGTLRFEISWYGSDPTAAAGDYNFATIDATMTKLAQQGIEPLPFVFGTPAWAAKLDGQSCNGAKCITFAPSKGRGLKAFKAFMADLVERYGPDGAFWTENPSLPKNPITEWQIWNEQNSDTFYSPKPNPAAFVKLMKAADAGIASVDPSAEVIMGGMFVSPRQGQKPSYFSYDFLDEVYDVKGASKYFDAVSAHPYAAKLKTVAEQVDLLRQSMKEGGDANADLYITEIGWASTGSKNPLVRGEKGQAQRLKQAFKYFLKKRNSFNLQTVVWYSWRDNASADVGLCAWCPGSGLVTEDLTAKPALDAFTQFTGGS